MLRGLVLAVILGTTILVHAGCSKEVSLQDALDCLDDAGIGYEERRGKDMIYDLERSHSERYKYTLDPGYLTIYVFDTVDQRREVQRNPFPAAFVRPPDGSYGMGTLLVFYYEGDASMAERLAEAFEPLNVFVHDPKHPEREVK
jgi:hypothetical protein